jgi:CcmD family protein
MKKIRSIIGTLLAIVCLVANAAAQSAATDVIQGNDFLRNTAKIYVVVGVIAIVFIGIVIFLIRLDKKLTKLENQIKNE